MTPLADSFGNVVDASDLEDALIATLTAWMPTYIAVMEAKTGRAAQTLPQVKAWRSASRFTQYSYDDLPCVIVVAGDATYTKRGRGLHSASWQVGVSVVAKADNAAASRALAAVYGTAVQLLLVQEGDLGGFAAETRLLRATTDAAQLDPRRQLGLAMNVFRVSVDNVLDASMGLVDVPSDPYTIADPYEAGSFGLSVNGQNVAGGGS